MPWSPGWHTLPKPEGSLWAIAYAVSADGETVVGAYNPPGTGSGGSVACYWKPDSMPVAIGTNWSEATGVSGDGASIIGHTNSAGGYPFLWTPGTGLQPFATTTDNVWDISADGNTIIGGFPITVPGVAQAGEACFWNRAGVRTPLGFLPGHNISHARAVSSDGTYIIGSSQVGIDDTTMRSWRWSAAGGMIHLGTVAGSTGSRPFSVSDDGQLIGGDLVYGGNAPYRWTPAGGMVMLPMNSGSGSVSASTANGSRLVGYTDYTGDEDYGSYYGNYFCYWLPDGTLVQIPPGQIDPTDSDLTSPNNQTFPEGVSADGKVTIGYTYNFSRPLAWLYAEPSGEAVATTLTDAELVFHPGAGFVDFAVEANRRKFVATGGTPQFLGSRGETPLATQPAVYLTTLGPPTDFAQNNGGGGAFAPTGDIDPATGPGCTPYYFTEAAGPAADPEWRLTVSDDGSRTWSRLVKPRGIGPLGHYKTRLRWLKMGAFRQRSVKLECTDPVRRNIIGIYIDLDQGMS